MHWVCQCSSMHADTARLLLHQRGLLTTVAITRALKVMVAAIVAHDAALALGASPKGAFLIRAARAVDRMPQASRDECRFANVDSL